MESIIKIVKILDKILTWVVAVFLLLMLIYSAYSLWDIKKINDSGLLDDDLLEYKPSREDKDNASLAELQKINPDVCGWITIDETHIDYPVVEGKDNLEYTNKDIYSKFSFSGTIFLDSRNAKDFSDSYNLLYGHNMENGAMFGDLNEFKDKEYFEKHSTGELYTLTQNYKIKIFACLKVDANDYKIFTPGNLDETGKESLISYIKDKALFSRDIDGENKNKLIALSTCCDLESNERMIVVGELEED